MSTENIARQVQAQHSPFDVTLNTGISIPKHSTNNHAIDTTQILGKFEDILTAANISADPAKNEYYRKLLRQTLRRQR